MSRTGPVRADMRCAYGRTVRCRAHRHEPHRMHIACRRAPPLAPWRFGPAHRFPGLQRPLVAAYSAPYRAMGMGCDAAGSVLLIARLRCADRWLGWIIGPMVAPSRAPGTGAVPRSSCGRSRISPRPSRNGGTRNNGLVAFPQVRGVVPIRQRPGGSAL